MNITVFGGAFDPPHFGHLKIINSLFEQKIADEVWLVPTGVHDFDKKMQSAEIRIAMLELLIAELPPKLQSKIKINTCELNRPGVSQTYDTLLELSAQKPQDKFSWIMGSDNLAKFHLWENYQRILTKFLVYIYPRLGFAMKPLYNGMVVLSGVEQVEVSSTKIKEILAKDSTEKLADFLPKTILQYIQLHNLY